ncbi:Usher syndrome type-1G protein homolog [Harmonia axyridis]|uniref:Usher syndrome type-1G protein homolog n=1 Tax=Harmonia axyridis TaxID=115357 RepID=UPI001E2750BA|nr:Usher syndrome type-1G protein homolog [Harmonia axyridis]
MSNRFHRAAKDGMIEVLKEATRKECNSKDEQGMTPTLYAAFYGHLDALRILCGRGGNPNKADLFGNTALHLAAAQGHKHVVTFLVNFDANIYYTDIDGRTAQELAGINNRDDILRFLDEVLTKTEAGDHKKAKAMKDKAKKDSEKRVKVYQKLKSKNEEMQERQVKKTQKTSVIETLKSRIKSGSMSNLSQVGTEAPRNNFSTLVSGNTISSKNRSTLQRKLVNRNNKLANDDEFKISEIEDGKRTISSIKGYRRDSEILYSGTLEQTRRGKLNGVFNEIEEVNTRNNYATIQSNGMSRSLSQPDFMQQLREEGLQKVDQEPASIFVRPGIGSMAFRKSITNTFSGVNGPEMTTTGESSIGSDSNYGMRNLISIEDELSDVESSEDDHPNGPLERFFTAWGLNEYLPKFEEQKIDLDTLMLMTESDLKTLNLPLGPHIKLMTAINERKSALEHPGEVIDSML